MCRAFAALQPHVAFWCETTSLACQLFVRFVCLTSSNMKRCSSYTLGGTRACECLRKDVCFTSLHLLRDTWLILPAVICSSERLSHACYKTCPRMANSRTAHYNRDHLLDLDSQVDNSGNSGANTCLDALTVRKGCSY